MSDQWSPATILDDNINKKGILSTILATYGKPRYSRGEGHQPLGLELDMAPLDYPVIHSV
ncbi:hypothetical protein F3157_07685 [Virgibacillus dakarensis]|nr:hypothetical protein [Virgibacillus dakarensis]MTW85544.1 hypothetical protein [Virgibacillus dakarensis]